MPAEGLRQAAEHGKAVVDPGELEQVQYTRSGLGDPDSPVSVGQSSKSVHQRSESAGVHERDLCEVKDQVSILLADEGPEHGRGSEVQLSSCFDDPPAPVLVPLSLQTRPRVIHVPHAAAAPEIGV